MPAIFERNTESQFIPSTKEASSRFELYNSVVTN